MQFTASVTFVRKKLTEKLKKPTKQTNKNRGDEEVDFISLFPENKRLKQKQQQKRCGFFSSFEQKINHLDLYRE